MLQHISCCLLIGILFRIQQCDCILNNRRQVKTGAAATGLTGERLYLSAKRPLWILDDSVQHNDFERVSYSSTARPMMPYTSNRRKKQQRQQNLPRRIKLPSHYSYPMSSANRARNMRRTELLIGSAAQQQHVTQSMPQFDSFPGQDNADPVPIFIYNGPKGELLLNTMLSAKQYPMEEPVPGDILYPPITPIFRPKPIVQRYRIHDQRSAPLNLTLIPFFAHDAIDPRSLPNFDDISPVITTTVAPSVFYVAPTVTSSPRPTPSSRQSKHSKLSKWQKYKVFRSKDEVQWRPSVKIVLPQTTTPFPMALASPPLRNHRYNDDGSSFTTSKPLTTHYKSMRDKEGNFRIIYTDESFERPTVDAAVEDNPNYVKDYVASEEIFAFPVFTLGKLLTPEQSSDDDGEKEVSETLSKVKGEETLEQQNASNTLFVLNSRYKGHLKNLTKYRYSSKYIENPSIITASNFAAYDVVTYKAPETILKHVPVTYFRTYTYQPLAGNPFSYPFLGGAGGAAGYGSPPLVAQSPLLAGPRYEAYGGAGYFPTTSTTTTSTTTRAPPPPPPSTTTTSTTTTTPTPTTVNTFAQGVPPISQYSADYPTYNRRFYNTGYNQPSYYRPSYPYPEYSTVNLATLKLASSMGERLSPNIQFVPCMCPISVDVLNGLDRKNSISSLFAETRSGSDEDDDLEIPLEKTKLLIEKDTAVLNQNGESNTNELKPTNKIDMAANEKLSNEPLSSAEEDSARI